MDFIKQTILETLSKEGMSELLGGTDLSTDVFEQVNNGSNGAPDKPCGELCRC